MTRPEPVSTAVESRESSAWRPLLVGDERERASSAVAAIAAALPGFPSDDPSLGSGNAGLAVFHAYRGDRDLAADRLDSALAAVASDASIASLYGGFAGVGWALTHLDNLFEAGEDPCAEVDEALVQMLRAGRWDGDYDLIVGLVGFAVYALERLPRPAAVACLELVVDRLAERAELQGDGATWWTAPELLPDWQRAQNPAGTYNFGVAHGIPGVIAVLARACASGVAEGTAQPLLEGAVDWLLAHRLPHGEASAFPSRWAPGRPARPSRLAWCYGDPGVATTLLVAGRCAGRSDWEETALGLLRQAAACSPEDSYVVDAGVCHGAAGVAHLFNRAHQTTGDPTLAAAARSWFGRALDHAEKGAGVGGFWEVHTHPEGTRKLATPGLLGGAAGIGLALLAATTDVEPGWDRILLASAPEGPRQG